jgi:putative hydrolase
MSSNENRVIAERLREAASLLEQQDANRYRVAAYRRAAETLDALPRDVSLIFRVEGYPGLVALQGIGPRIAGAIAEMLRTGRWTQIERLRGSLDPEALFSSVPGIGPKLARQVMSALHIDTLEALEAAAHDGRLARVPRFGPRRLAMVRAELALMLGRVWRRPIQRDLEPDIGLLLDLDREYREKASAGQLRTIAPKRFNPNHEAWLPVLHTERGPWQFSVLFSNTALAHNLGRTRDWVIIYFHHELGSEGQRTVVTETRGPIRGQRTVRGRELECEAHYGLATQPAVPA